MKNWYELYFGKTHTQVVPPSALLCPYISKYLIYENREGKRVRRHLRPLPNGFTEVFFHLNGSQIYFLEKGARQKMSCFSAGIFELNHPLQVDIYSPSPI